MTGRCPCGAPAHDGIIIDLQDNLATQKRLIEELDALVQLTSSQLTDMTFERDEALGRELALGIRLREAFIAASQGRWGAAYELAPEWKD